MEIFSEFCNDELEITITDIELEVILSGDGWSKLEGDATINEIRIIINITDDNSEYLNNISFFNRYKDNLDLIDLEIIKKELSLLSIYVICEHDRTWNIYNDTNFKKVVSNFLNKSLTFTEQGMQCNNHASLE